MRRYPSIPGMPEPRNTFFLLILRVKVCSQENKDLRCCKPEQSRLLPCHGKQDLRTGKSNSQACFTETYSQAPASLPMYLLPSGFSDCYYSAQGIDPHRYSLTDMAVPQTAQTALPSQPRLHPRSPGQLSCAASRCLCPFHHAAVKQFCLPLPYSQQDSSPVTDQSQMHTSTNRA